MAAARRRRRQHGVSSESKGDDIVNGVAAGVSKMKTMAAYHQYRGGAA